MNEYHFLIPSLLAAIFIACIIWRDKLQQKNTCLKADDQPSKHNLTNKHNE